MKAARPSGSVTSCVDKHNAGNRLVFPVIVVLAI